MQVQLIGYTGFGSPDPSRLAAELMIFTKQTRLNMSAGLMEEISAWPQERIDAELDYMAKTIPSSWEFCDYTFLITNVTRAFTHQFVRTRAGSYAQQTMRVLNKKGWTYKMGPSFENLPQAREEYHETMSQIAKTYDHLIDSGVKIEDARGVLPTNITTNIVAKFNLRTLSEMFRKRASSRTQGEYRDVIDLMKEEVIRVHPWADKFFNQTFDVAAAELEERIKTLCGQLKTGDILQTNLIKLIDQMRAMI